MNYYYVQINESSIVVATLQTYAPIEKPTMIQTDRLRNDLLGWKYENGQFYPPNS